MKLVFFTQDKAIRRLTENISGIDVIVTDTLEGLEEVIEDDRSLFFIDFDFDKKHAEAINSELAGHGNVRRVVISSGMRLKDLKKHQKTKDAAHGYLMKPLTLEIINGVLNDYELADYILDNRLGGDEPDIELAPQTHFTQQMKAMPIPVPVKEKKESSASVEIEHDFYIAPDVKEEVTRHIAVNQSEVLDSKINNEIQAKFDDVFAGVDASAEEAFTLPDFAIESETETDIPIIEESAADDEGDFELADVDLEMDDIQEIEEVSMASNDDIDLEEVEIEEGALDFDIDLDETKSSSESLAADADGDDLNLDDDLDLDEGTGDIDEALIASANESGHGELDFDDDSTGEFEIGEDTNPTVVADTASVSMSDLDLNLDSDDLAEFSAQNEENAIEDLEEETMTGALDDLNLDDDLDDEELLASDDLDDDLLADDLDDEGDNEILDQEIDDALGISLDSEDDGDEPIVQEDRGNDDLVSELFASPEEEDDSNILDFGQDDSAVDEDVEVVADPMNDVTTQTVIADDIKPSAPVFAVEAEDDEPELGHGQVLESLGQPELLRLQATIKQLREERSELMRNVDSLKGDLRLVEQDKLTLKAELEESRIEINILKKRHAEENEEAKHQVRVLEEKKSFFEEKTKMLQKEFDRLSHKVRIDFNKVKQREKELEGQLELVSMDTQAQVKSRDMKILELKRKIDALEFNMENATIREQKSREDKARLEERLHKMMKTLRGSIKFLEDDIELDGDELGQTEKTR